MSEGNASTAQTTPANRGVKHGLPATGLPAAEGAAEKLWAVARRGTASPEAFARQFGDKAKASGGGWDTRIAVLRGFKLIRFDGKLIGLSELGLQLVNTSDPIGQKTARRTALMNLKAYRELVEAFQGTQLPAKASLASKLQFEYGKTGNFAQRAAQAFIDSLTHAGMLDEDSVVQKNGTSPVAPIPHPAQEAILGQSEDVQMKESNARSGDAEAAEVADEEAQAEAIDRAFDGGYEDLDDQSDLRDSPEQPTTPGVTLALSLDLSHFRADEVMGILSALGFVNHG